MIALDIPGLAAGLRMQVHAHGDRMISERLRRDRCWEAYETQLTLQLLRPGEVYVDAGANIGYYTLVAAQRVGPAGRVFAYEPDPANFALLQANVALNGFGQVQLFDCALSDHDGEGRLFLSADNFGDHRVYTDEQAGEQTGARADAPLRDSCPIRLVAGAAHLGRHTQRMDFLKIDTQGAEYAVVQGLWPLIEANRAHLRLMLEFCPYGIRHAGGDGLALVGLLEALDMDLHIIDHQQECLIPAQGHHLADWVMQMAAEPANEGFVNLLLTPKK